MDDRVVAALDEAVRGIAEVLDVERVLQLIVDRLRDLAEADYAALGIVDEAGVIERFITSGLSHDERERIGELPRGKGLLGLIIQENRSVRIRDIGSDPRRHGFPPNHPPMGSFLGVPITLHGRSVGRLYLTNKRGAPEFSSKDQALVERFAMHAGIAMENARLHEAERRLVVVDERERIGRDLHDGIIQNLYGVTLSLEDVPELVTEDPEEARDRVDRAIDTLHGAIRDIRNFIFGLRPILLDDYGLTEGLEQLADELRRNAAIEVSVTATEPRDLPIESVVELLAVAREALSNVARHARATRVSIGLAVVGDAAQLTISDDGIGFDADATRPGIHLGLANLRERAQRLGGTASVESRPGEGARIMLSLPLSGPSSSRRTSGEELA
jgi:two-component system, NarL family, sensor histidine kinase DevS